MILSLILAALFALQKPSFEIVSVKANNTGSGGPILVMGDRFVATGVSLKNLVQYAYRVPTDQSLEAVGGPKWVESDRFDIEGKIATDRGPLGAQQAVLMLQTLLEGRFQLKVHREARDTAVYILAIGKNGPKLKLSEDQAPAAIPLPQNAPSQTGIQTPFGVIRPGPAALPNRGMIRRAGEDMVATGVRLPFVASFFGTWLGRPVIDKTGLDGLYDFTLHWVPGPTNGPGTPPGPEAVASLFPAVEEIGLKLESTRLPIDVLVIDSVQRPSEN
jgi:uncharacterized protein (TIGR03435 family)